MISENVYKKVISMQQEIINLLMQDNGIDERIESKLDIQQSIETETVKNTKKIKEFEEYLKYKGCSENTKNSYMFAITKYFEKYDEINEQNLMEYQNYLKENFKPKTVNIRIAAMSKYLKFIGFDFEFVRSREQKKTFCDNAINEEQYNRYVKWCFENEKYTSWKVAKIIASTGVRVSELIRLKTEDLDNGYVDITSKGNKTRRIFFPENLVKEIKPYCTGVYLVENKYGEQLTTRGISSSMIRHGELAGIPKEVMHPHSFRHYFAKQFMKKSDNITLLGDLLGHSDLSTTAIYTRQTSEEQKKGVDKIIDW